MANKYTAMITPSKGYLLALYRKGLTQTEIGRVKGVSQKVVWRWFRVLGIKSRVPRNLKQWGSNNPQWKGDSAGIEAMHIRLVKRFGKPKECWSCGCNDKNKKYDWANLTGNYQNINDYKRLCRSCHSKLDKKELNFKAGDAQ